MIFFVAFLSAFHDIWKIDLEIRKYQPDLKGNGLEEESDGRTFNYYN